MPLASRNDYAGLWFMPETTAGVNPGILAASVVAGGTGNETTRYQPMAGYRAFARLAAAPEGLPKLSMKEVEQAYTGHDYDPHYVPALKSEGEFTLTFQMHGAVIDTNGASPTNRPSPPPWLRLAGSACGVVLGYRNTDKGGAATTIATSTPATGEVFTTAVLATGSLGFSPGHMFVVNVGTGAATPDWRLVRPVSTSSGIALIAASCTYQGVAFGVGASEPQVSDVLLHATQAIFDKRLEASSESFTFLFPRSEPKTWQIIRGVRATNWEFEEVPNELTKIKITFTFMSWTNYGDGAADWTATPSTNFQTTAPVDFSEPAYYANWPCSQISNDAQFAYLADPEGSGASIVRTLDIASIKVSWNAGYKRYMAQTAVEGCAAILSSDRQQFRVTIKCLYAPDFRDLLNAALSANVVDTFPFSYLAGNVAGRMWGLFVTAAKLIQDPGFDGEIENNQAQELTFGCHNYDSDAGSFDLTGALSVDSKFAIGVFT